MEKITKYELPKNVNFSFSNQATVIISNLNNFDKQDFINWFTKKLPIGSNNIMEYLLFKDKEKNNGISK